MNGYSVQARKLGVMVPIVGVFVFAPFAARAAEPASAESSAKATNVQAAATNTVTVATNALAAAMNAPAAGTNLQNQTTNRLVRPSQPSRGPTNLLTRPGNLLSRPTNALTRPVNRRNLPFDRAALLTNRLAQRTNAPLAAPAQWERRLYVADQSGLSLYNIDDEHKLLRKIEVPGAGEFRGLCASAPLGRLYVTANLRDELICLDLIQETVVWRRKYGSYADSPALTPDGRALYLPCRHDGNWWVLNPLTGEVLTKIPVGLGEQYRDQPIGDTGPHLTWCHPWSARMYLTALTVPYVFIADPFTHEIAGAIGRFSKGLQAFAVADSEQYVFACVDGLLGFEVGELRTGRMIHRVEARTPPERLRQMQASAPRAPHSSPSQGLALHPNQREVWVADGVYGYIYVADVTRLPPRFIASIPLFERPEDQPHPGWISFGLDGWFAYVEGVGVIDTTSRRVITRLPLSETFLEIDFWNGRPNRAGSR